MIDYNNEHVIMVIFIDPLICVDNGVDKSAKSGVVTQRTLTDKLWRGGSDCNKYSLRGGNGYCCWAEIIFWYSGNIARASDMHWLIILIWNCT